MQPPRNFTPFMRSLKPITFILKSVCSDWGVMFFLNISAFRCLLSFLRVIVIYLLRRDSI